jgi:hypothetical protein
MTTMRVCVFLAAALPLLAQGEKVSPLLAGRPEGYVVQFRDEAAARRVASTAGAAVIHHPDLLPGQLIFDAGAQSAGRLAADDDVVRIFPASPELLRGERVVACAGALVEGAVAETFSLYGNGWPAAGGGAELRYHIANSPGDIPLEQVTGEIRRALGAWAQHGNVRFAPALDAQGDATIAIRFARGSHGDAYPFDGQGRVLAHTFYPSPPNPEPLAGDMHLDADETWGIGVNTDIYTVVLHELGHALGIGHSDQPGAVMYPYYRSLTALSADDIAAVQSLYGMPLVPAGPGPAPPPLSISVTDPAAGTTSAESIALAGRVEGGAPPAQVRWESDRGGAGPALGAPAWRIENVPLSAGLNRITISALDSAGDSASQTISVTRVAPVPEAPFPEPPFSVPSPPGSPAPQPANPSPPAAPLSLTITSPAMTITSTSAATITFRGSASGAARVTWTSSTNSSGYANGATAWTADIPLLVGTNMITVAATNEAGDRVWRSVTVVRR